MWLFPSRHLIQLQGFTQLNQLHLNSAYREMQLLKGWFSHCCLMSCHHSWQALWTKMSYNINEKASVFQQWLPVPGGKPIFRATWFLLSLLNQNKALLRRDNPDSASRLMLHTPQGNAAGTVQRLTLSILTNNQVHIQVKRKWVVSEAKVMGLTHYQQSTSVPIKRK